MAITNLPELEIDLSGPDGNMYFVLGLVRERLNARYGDTEGVKQMSEIDAWMKAGNGHGEYAQLLLFIHEYFIRIIDTSELYDFDDPLFDPVSD